MRTLLVYGSRWGGTVEVAKTIAKALENLSFEVDVVDAKESPKVIDAYEFILVGSGLRADKWTKESLNFLSRNAELLNGKKVALFVSCSMADRKDAGYDKGKKCYLEDIAVQYGLSPISLGYFGGLMDFSYSHGLLVDIIVRVNRRNLRKNGLDTAEVHDTRDWAEIETWAKEAGKLALK